MIILVPNDTTTNFAIVAEGKDIRVHKIVLIAQSPFLAQFLTADQSCSRINANNARYDAMNVIVKIMYSQHFDGIVSPNKCSTIIASPESFFVPYRYDFSVLLSAWEISMHFQMMRLAKVTCAPLLIPLVSSYTSVRALRSCLKHPHDEGALEIRAKALCFIPPLLDTADQITEWKVLQEKYPFLIALADAREEKQRVKSQVNLQESSVSSGLDLRGIHPPFGGRSNIHQLSQHTPLHSQQQTDPSSGSLFPDTSKDPYNLSNVLNSSSVNSNVGLDQNHHYQEQELGHSSYAAPTHSSFPSLSTQEHTLTQFNHNGINGKSNSLSVHPTNISNRCNEDSDTRNNLTSVEPLLKLLPLIYNREPHMQMMRELEATLASLRGDYHEGTKEWKREEEHLNYLLENIESQDSEVAELLKAVAAADKDAQRAESRISELMKEKVAMEKSIADNMQYLESSVVYVPSAQEAYILLNKNLDSIGRQLAQSRVGRSRSSGGCSGSDVRLMLKTLLNEMKADKQDMTKELQEQQRLSEGLSYYAQQEKEKSSAIRGELVAMGR